MSSQYADHAKHRYARNELITKAARSVAEYTYKSYADGFEGAIITLHMLLPLIEKPGLSEEFLFEVRQAIISRVHDLWNDLKVEEVWHNDGYAWDITVTK